MDIVQFCLEDQLLRDRYDQLFEQCPNAFIQQSTYWAEVIKDLGPDQPIFLICSEDDQDLAGLPLYLYEQGSGNVLTSIPHPGPLGGIFLRDGLSTAEISKIYACLIERTQEIAQANRCLALSIITNPFFDDLELYQKYLTPRFILENFTQHIDLTEVIDDDGKIQLQDYNKRSNLSRNLQKAHTAGFSVVKCESNADLERMYQVQVQRHQELGVRPLDFRLFENIRRYLEPRGKALLLLVKECEDVASGGVYIYHRNVLDVLRLTGNSKYTSQSPNYLNTEHSLKWARGQNVKMYNWQSAPNRESGVYRYKKQWGSREVEYYFVTQLFCDVELVQKMGQETLRTKYSNHYVVPYVAFEEGFDRTHFKK